MVEFVSHPPARHRAWPRIFGLGLVLWLACLVTIYATRNVALVPSLILLGSFLVPVTFAAWAFETWRDEDVSTELIVTSFVVGGLLGALGASVLEAYLLRPSPLLFLGVGLIEEAAKLAALLLVTRRMARRHTRDGVVLGTAVGLGFAAFESAGYAFQTLLAKGGGLDDLIRTEVLRGLLTPFGHGLWTGILGGVIFHRLMRRRGHRWTDAIGPGVVLAYLGVSLLHALWDAMPDLVNTLTQYYTGLVVVSLLGILALVAVLVRSRGEGVRGHALRTTRRGPADGRPERSIG
jgi:RsiW-degrading membrane proteinase PrsW (M82 family)